MTAVVARGAQYLGSLPRAERGGPPPNTTIRLGVVSRIVTRPRVGASHRGWRRAGALAALALVLASCSGERVTGSVGPSRPGTTGTTGDTGSSGEIAARLVGRWSRTIYFYDDNGDLQSSQTVWTFAADGGGARTVYARNVTWGYEDAVVTLVRWQTDGGNIVVTYQAPDAGTARFAYRLESSIDGDLLWLGGTPFVRLVP